MNTQTETGNALSDALRANFGGLTEIVTIQRGSFTLTSSTYADDDILVIDQWVDGGGHELVKSGGELSTRVYVGHSLPDETLKSLGTSKGEIMKFLAEVIADKSRNIRLETPFDFTNDTFRYEYRILDSEPDFEITVGKEKIFYKNRCVFVHVFAKSPVNT